MYTPHVISIIIAVGAFMACFLPRALLTHIERDGPSRIPATATNGDECTDTGIASVIAAIIARTASGGNVRDAFREQYGMEFATSTITPARAAATLRRHATTDETEQDIVRIARQLASACLLSERLGCGAAHCLQSVSDSYRRDCRARDLRRETFAAPKATIVLLSVLPLATVGLGEFMGARPLAFLFGSAKGAICLFLGLAWYAIGLLWIRQLFARFATHGHDDQPLPLLLEMIGAALSQGAPIPTALSAVGQTVGGRLATVLREAGAALLRQSTWHEAWVGACATLDEDDNRDKNGDGTTAGIGGLGGFGGLGSLGGFGSLGAIGNIGGTGSGAADSSGNARAHKTTTGKATARKTASKSATGKTATEAGSTIERNAMLIADCLEDAWIHGSSPMERLRLAVEECESTERSAIEQAAARLSVQLLAPTGLCFLPSFILIGIIPAIASFAA